MPEDGGPVGDSATASYSGFCPLCHQHKSKRSLLKCGCPSHGGYACYGCLRNYYIVGPKTVYNFSFRCHHPGCQQRLPNKLIQSIFAKGERLGYDSRTEFQRYSKLARLARYNKKILGSDWESILKNLQTMARIMGISFKIGAQVPRTPHEAWYRRNNCDDGFAKCKFCNTIVLKDGGCDHMECPTCGKDYSFSTCKISIHEMDVGTVYIVSARNGKGRYRPKLRLIPVMEDVETEWRDDGEEEDDEDEHGDSFGKEASFSSGDGEGFVGEDDETSLSETSHISLWVDDLMSGIYDGTSIVSAGEDTKQSWSIVSSALQPEESLSSFSVVSGIGSVCSLDEFDDLTFCAKEGVAGRVSPSPPVSCCDVGENPTPTVSYCDVVKKLTPAAAASHETSHHGDAGGAHSESKDKPKEEEKYGGDGGLFVYDDAKYDDPYIDEDLNHSAFDAHFIRRGVKEGRGGKRRLLFKGNQRTPRIKPRCREWVCPCKSNIRGKARKKRIDKCYRETRMKKKDRKRR